MPLTHQAHASYVENLDDPGMSEKPEKKPQRNDPDFVFIFATLCSLPFLFLLGFVVVELFNKHSSSGSVVSTIFFIPFFLLATVLAAIFIKLSWKKSRPNCKPYLFLYATAICIYWVMLLNLGQL
jgi:amino acid transporter